MPTIEEPCAGCGKTISRYVKPSRMEKRKRLFCDRECHSEFFSGPGNPMKDPASQRKASLSAIEKFKDPEERKKIARTASQNWADGLYEGVAVGQCDWHSYTKRDGQVIKLQGTWELAYARWMDESGMPFDAHSGRLPYVDDNGMSRSYYPDFRVVNGSYVDVKNPYYEKLHARKLELVCEQNNVVVRVINKQEMERLGLL